MVALTFSDGSTITATDHHPFWEATASTFTDAIDLRIGDEEGPCRAFGPVDLCSSHFGG
jgi:hypothetical protein